MDFIDFANVLSGQKQPNAVSQPPVSQILLQGFFWEKSAILLCFESVTELAKVAEVPNTVTAGIIDAQALFHMIKPDKMDGEDR